MSAVVSSPKFTPGLRTRVPFADYQELAGVHATSLKVLARSPLHYRHQLEHAPESKAMRLGTVAHTAVLEPHRFLAEYVLWDRQTASGASAPRNGKAWEDFKASAGRKKIVTRAEYEHAVAIAAAVHRNREAMRYLVEGEPEVSMQWELDGLHCKGRLDWLPSKGDALVGLKTTRDAGPVPFGNQACKLGYDISWAFYADGYETLKGERRRTIEIVVESAPPHDVVVYVVPDEILDRGRDLYRAFIRQLLECEAADEWPGIGGGREQTLTFPTWAFQEDEDDLGLEGSDNKEET